MKGIEYYQQIPDIILSIQNVKIRSALYFSQIISNSLTSFTFVFVM